MRSVSRDQTGRSARFVDAALILLAVVYIYLTLLGGEAYEAIPAWYWPIDVGLAVLAAASLWWSRTHPAAVGAWLIIPGSLSLTAGFAVLAGVYRMGSYARPRVSLPLAGLHILFALPYHGVAPIPGMTWLAWLIFIPLVYLLALSFGLLTRARRQVIEGLRQTARTDRERFDAQLSSLRRDERERIAREMHDVLAHRISLVSVHAGALEFRTGHATEPGQRPMSGEEVHEAAVIIRENAHLAVEELRELLHVLRHDDGAEPALGVGRPQPQLDDVHGLVAEARQAGQQVEVSIDADAVSHARASVQRTAYRIVQEGLTNARKHAPRSPVRVAIRGEDDRLRVEVSNPVALGLTESEIPGAGAGLAGLRERVHIDGGQLHHAVTDGEFALAGDLPMGAA